MPQHDRYARFAPARDLARALARLADDPDRDQKAASLIDEAAKHHFAASDAVNHPAHYTQGGIECIEAIKASMSPEAFRGFLKGNVLKYNWRYETKGGAEDLRKAQFYQARLIRELEGLEAQPE